MKSDKTTGRQITRRVSRRGTSKKKQTTIQAVLLGDDFSGLLDELSAGGFVSERLILIGVNGDAFKVVTSGDMSRAEALGVMTLALDEI